MTATSDPASSREHALPLRGAVLLLDMDGTLIDSGPAVERSWNPLFSELGFGEAAVMMLDTLRSPGTMPPSRPACDVRIWDHDRYFGPRLLARARAAAARSGAAAGHGRHPDRLGAGRRTVLEHAVLRARVRGSGGHDARHSTVTRDDAAKPSGVRCENLGP